MPKISTDNKKIQELLTRGVDEVIEKDSIEKKLKSGKQLRIKFGADPSRPDLHLGHAVPMRKLKQFQDLGHQVIFLIGDFTATIGDPSGRSETRPMLTKQQIKDNMKTYVEQAAKILDLKKTEIRYNSEWYDKKGVMFLLELSSKFTTARILERDDFKKRIKEDVDISMIEIMYPLLQGYDSLELKADIEIGGTDQKFNLLMGRKVQRRYNSPEQDIITLPLIEGLDGVRKMSKSYDNYIGLTEEANQMYGKIMSLPDSLLWKYFKLLTAVSLAEIDKMRQEARHSIINPRDCKMKLAREIVKIYHDKIAATDAEQNFINQFQKHKIPDDIETIKFKEDKLNIIELLVKTKLVPSKNEARRMVAQNAVKIDGEVVVDVDQEVELKNGMVVQKGKRGFVKIAK